MNDPITTNDSTVTEEKEDEAAPEVSADTVASLYFEQMKQIITLSVAVAGGTLRLRRNT